MEAINGGTGLMGEEKGAPPPPSPLTGCYLLVVIGEPHSAEHKDIILQKIAKGLLSWDVNDCLVDLEKELAIIIEQGLEGEEARYGERLIQFASENLVTEILIHPAVSTLSQCIRNLLSSFTRHRHIIHAGYTFQGNGSWALQDGTFSYSDFSEAFQEIEVQRVIHAYENGISIDLHCCPEGEWTRLPKEYFTKSCKVRVNPTDVLTTGSPSITSFIKYLEPFLVPTVLEDILESSDVVGNIRFSRPTLYVFPGGQGDAALFGINGFNMLLDGGYSRKACFWDFVRHLDRLDAVLMTRLNNSNVSGISSVLKRKQQGAVYPQVGHFFCNIQERKSLLSPDGDKDRDPLIISLLEEGQSIIQDVKHLNLASQTCFRDSEPIILYHKVGHGTLNMYVLSPDKNSREVREFMQKWNQSDPKLFPASKTGKEFTFPLQNLVSICALLVWQPANPNDTITRILYPGSAPQKKILEGLDKIKGLECMKQPVCTVKSIMPVKKSKQDILDKIAPKEISSKNIIGEKKSENKVLAEDAGQKHEMNGDVVREKAVKKSDSVESDKEKRGGKKVEETKKVEENGKIVENGDKAKPKPRIDHKSRARTESQQRKKPAVEKKGPPTPKKSVEDKSNGEIKEREKKMPHKPSPQGTPAKSTKDANNRKVIESKKAPQKKEPVPKPASVEKPKVKPERQPISRRPKAVKGPPSPMKKMANGVQKPDSLTKRGKLDKEGTTDSSTVSTPSAEQESILKKDISKLTPEELQQLKEKELEELNEEQEAVKEIEAVFRKGEVQADESEPGVRKIKEISIEDNLETEEYLIIEKEEVEHDSLDQENKEDEMQKLARDSEESEKQRKLSAEEIKVKEQETVKTEPQDEPKGEDLDAKKQCIISPEDKMASSLEKKDLAEEEVKEVVESHLEEKVSANIESGATTTAPTLPEDERITLDEIKEDNGQPIEEKHVKEETKEKEVPIIQLPPKSQQDSQSKPPQTVPGIPGLDKQRHIRDIVKTPDEVADLPVHEEADYQEYQEDKKSNEVEKPSEKKDAEVAKKEEEVVAEKPATETRKTDDKKDKESKPIDTKPKEFIEEDSKQKEAVIEATVSEKTDNKIDVLEKAETETKEKSDQDNNLLYQEDIDDEWVVITKDTEEKTKEAQPIVEEPTIPKDTKEPLQNDKEQQDITESDLSDHEIREEDEIHETIEKDKEDITALIEEADRKPIAKEIDEHKAKDVSKELETASIKSEEKVAAIKESTQEIEAIDDKLQELKKEAPLVEADIDLSKPVQDLTKIEQPPQQVDLKKEYSELTKIDDKLSELKSKAEEEEISIEKSTRSPEHAEPVVLLDSSPEEDGPRSPFKDLEFDKSDLGRKSPAEREEDVKKIVASVAEVLKSEEPLETFQGKLTFTQELRETHITTQDSPILEVKIIKTDDIPPIPEEATEAETEEHIHDSEIRPLTVQLESQISDDKEDEAGTVHRMLVTASSEDGGEEIEICPAGTITFSRSSESSGRSSPEHSQKTQSQKSSIVETLSDTISTVKQAAEKTEQIFDTEVDRKLENLEKHGITVVSDDDNKLKEVTKTDMVGEIKGDKPESVKLESDFEAVPKVDAKVTKEDEHHEKEAAKAEIREHVTSEKLPEHENKEETKQEKDLDEEKGEAKLSQSPENLLKELDSKPESKKLDSDDRIFKSSMGETSESPIKLQDTEVMKDDEKLLKEDSKSESKKLVSEIHMVPKSEDQQKADVKHQESDLMEQSESALKLDSIEPRKDDVTEQPKELKEEKLQPKGDDKSESKKIDSIISMASKPEEPSLLKKKDDVSEELESKDDGKPESKKLDPEVVVASKFEDLKESDDHKEVDKSPESAIVEKSEFPIKPESTEAKKADTPSEQSKEEEEAKLELKEESKHKTKKFDSKIAVPTKSEDLKESKDQKENDKTSAKAVMEKSQSPIKAESTEPKKDDVSEQPKALPEAKLELKEDGKHESKTDPEVVVVSKSEDLKESDNHKKSESPMKLESTEQKIDDVSEKSTQLEDAKLGLKEDSKQESKKIDSEIDVVSKSEDLKKSEDHKKDDETPESAVLEKSKSPMKPESTEQKKDNVSEKQKELQEEKLEFKEEVKQESKTLDQEVTMPPKADDLKMSEDHKKDDKITESALVEKSESPMKPESTEQKQDDVLEKQKELQEEKLELEEVKQESKTLDLEVTMPPKVDDLKMSEDHKKDDKITESAAVEKSESHMKPESTEPKKDDVLEKPKELEEPKSELKDGKPASLDSDIVVVPKPEKGSEDLKEDVKTPESSKVEESVSSVKPKSPELEKDDVSEKSKVLHETKLEQKEDTKQESIKLDSEIEMVSKSKDLKAIKDVDEKKDDSIADSSIKPESTESKKDDVVEKSKEEPKIDLQVTEPDSKKINLIVEKDHKSEDKKKEADKILDESLPKKVEASEIPNLQEEKHDTKELSKPDDQKRENDKALESAIAEKTESLAKPESNEPKKDDQSEEAKELQQEKLELNKDSTPETTKADSASKSEEIHMETTDKGKDHQKKDESFEKQATPDVVTEEVHQQLDSKKPLSLADELPESIEIFDGKKSPESKSADETAQEVTDKKYSEVDKDTSHKMNGQMQIKPCIPHEESKDLPVEAQIICQATDTSKDGSNESQLNKQISEASDVFKASKIDDDKIVEALEHEFAGKASDLAIDEKEPKGTSEQRRQSIVEKAEDFIEKTEEAIESVFSSISSKAHSILDGFMHHDDAAEKLTFEKEATEDIEEIKSEINAQVADASLVTKEVAKEASEAFDEMKKETQTKLSEAIKSTGDKTEGALEDIGEKVMEIKGVEKEALQEISDGVKDKAEDTASAAKEIAKKVGEAFDHTKEKLSETSEKASDNLEDVLEHSVEKLTDKTPDMAIKEKESSESKEEKLGTPHRRESIMDKAEDFIEKTEEAFESVISSIGSKAHNILDGFKHHDSGKTDDDLTKELKTDSSILSGQSSPHLLEDTQLEILTKSVTSTPEPLRVDEKLDAKIKEDLKDSGKSSPLLASDIDSISADLGHSLPETTKDGSIKEDDLKGRRSSIIEAAEEFIEKSEKVLESVFSAIGENVQSAFHMPESGDQKTATTDLSKKEKPQDIIDDHKKDSMGKTETIAEKTGNIFESALTALEEATVAVLHDVIPSSDEKGSVEVAKDLELHESLKIEKDVVIQADKMSDSLEHKDPKDKDKIESVDQKDKKQIIDKTNLAPDMQVGKDNQTDQAFDKPSDGKSDLKSRDDEMSQIEEQIIKKEQKGAEEIPKVAKCEETSLTMEDKKEQKTTEKEDIQETSKELAKQQDEPLKEKTSYLDDTKLELSKDQTDSKEKIPLKAESYKVDKDSLEKEEKQIEEEVKHLEKSFDEISSLTKSVQFEKCHPQEEPSVHKDKVDTVSKEIPSVSDKHDNKDAEKVPYKLETEEEYKVPKETLKQEEKEIEEEVGRVMQTVEEVSHLTKTITFDKCHADESKVDKDAAEKEKTSPKSGKPESIESDFDGTFKVSKEVIKKEEKRIDDEVSHLQKSYDDLAKLTEQVSFDKCKTTDDFKLEKEILEKEERRFGEEAEALRQSYEDLTKITEEVTFDKCHVDFKEADKVKSHEKQIDDKIDQIKDTITDLEKLNESVIFERCKSPEKSKADKDSLEKEKEEKPTEESTTVKTEKVDSNKADHLAHLAESSKKEETAVMIDSSIKLERKEDLTEPTKVEIKDSITHLDDKPVPSQAEKCEKERMEKTQIQEESSKLQVVSPEPKKLSISDVEISLKTDINHKDLIQSFLDNEKSFVCDNTDAKVFIAPKEDDVCEKDESSKVEVKESTETEPSSNKSSPEADLSGRVTPPTVPLSPVNKDLRSPSLKLDSGMSEQTETDEDDLSTKSQVAHSQSDLDELDMKMDPMSMSFYGALPEEQFHDEGDVPATYLYEITKARFSSPSKSAKGEPKVVEEECMMSASFIGELPSSSIGSKPSSDTKETHSKDTVESWGKPLGLPAPTYLYEVTKAKFSSRSEESELMTASFIGNDLPSSRYQDPMTTSVYFGDDDDLGAPWRKHADLATSQRKEEDPMTASVYFGDEEDPIASWGKPLGLPSPAPPNNNDRGTPKKERKVPAHVTAKNKLNDERKRAESPSKLKNKKVNAVYVDLTYVPHHGNHYYSYVDFFKRIRARYYVFSGLEPSRQVYDALLEAKQTWDDKELEVTIIPTYDTDILGYWVAENEELLSKFKIDLAPSASRCTINLQDHETSCSAYRLEF
ncbi:microtubule-associated protein futsch [Anthonomus grandis grandis]|uniref:microtubule-associated protein futsch n=1 Tax=Anthonomus grandis grandis TaxID=2921223 RepID=UPI002165EC4F|nr:microtubule-associated protein futsch [Anthonomus grandis grandis]